MSIERFFCSLDHIEKIDSFPDITSLRVARKNEERGQIELVRIVKSSVGQIHKNAEHQMLKTNSIGC